MFEINESVPKTDSVIQANGINDANGVEQPTDDAEEERWWRGVFCPEIKREELFRIEIDLNTVSLPRWEPFIYIDPNMESDDDE